MCSSSERRHQASVKLGPIHDCAVMGCISPGHVVARGEITVADDSPSCWMPRAESGLRVYLPQDDRASYQRCPAMIRKFRSTCMSAMDSRPATSCALFWRTILCAAVGRADDDNLALLANIVAYAYETVPSGIYGTPAKVEAHLTEKRKQREAALEEAR